MNDIELLDKLINKCKCCKFATCEQCEINWTEVKAIENLINRVKELEARKYMYNADTKTITMIPLDNNYIPKSKIKEKIELIKNLNEKIYYEENVISILQELLEEEE